MSNPVPHFEKEVTIDAQVRGNWTRFISHSCIPNTIFATRRVGQMRMIFKDIAVGEEVTIHYGQSYFDVRTCHCGTPNCLEVAKAMKKALWEAEADVDESLESIIAGLRLGG
jgi:SET domain-containing protein